MSFQLHRGSAPLLVSMPHIATEIPADLRDGYVPRAHAVEDTDWHLAQLYAFATELGASLLQPRYSRYVIDLNRPPDNTPMYPGASNTELCPTRFFNGDALYADGAAPDADQQHWRRTEYWQPYHDALAGELQRLRREHGRVLLWDAHSIRCEIPWLFEGVLPDLNIGSGGGTSADASITEAVAAVAARAAPFTHAVNGRFKGGYITRNYGRPAANVHAIQLEMTQKLYMNEAPPYEYLPERAGRIQPLLREMVAAALAAMQALHGR
jgi:N-formylglutamate deformylase